MLPTKELCLNAEQEIEDSSALDPKELPSIVWSLVGEKIVFLRQHSSMMVTKISVVFCNMFLGMPAPYSIGDTSSRECAHLHLPRIDSCPTRTLTLHTLSSLSSFPSLSLCLLLRVSFTKFLNRNPSWLFIWRHRRRCYPPRVFVKELALPPLLCLFSFSVSGSLVAALDEKHDVRLYHTMQRWDYLTQYADSVRNRLFVVVLSLRRWSTCNFGTRQSTKLIQGSLFPRAINRNSTVRDKWSPFTDNFTVWVQCVSENNIVTSF